MKFLIYTIIPLLFFAACTCDAEYVCDGQENAYVSTKVFLNDFSQAEMDSLKLLLHSKIDNQIIQTYPMGKSIYKPISSNKYTYDLDFPLSSYDLTTHYFVFQVNNFTDTIGNFYYESQDTTLYCYGGCNGGTEIRSIVFFNNFYFIHKGDTITDEVTIQR